jgi:AcrR family transcriptional regulator
LSRERAILDAAAEAFYEKGFHGVGVDELGTRAGLSGPSLYRHFSGKDEILATLLSEAMDELISATVPVFNEPARDLERALEHHIDYTLQHRHLVNLYQREARSLAEPWKRSFSRRIGQYTARWEALFAQNFPGLDAAAVAAATQACLGMIFSMASWPARALLDVDVKALIMELMSRGFGSLDGSASATDGKAAPARGAGAAGS